MSTLDAALPVRADLVYASTDPGFFAFLGFLVLAVVLWLLMRNMNARMRRMSYRQSAAHRGKDDPQADESDVAEGSGDAGDDGPPA